MGEALIFRILLTLWKPLATLLGAIGLYAKGRADAKAAAKLEAAFDTLDAYEVRNEVDNRIARERLARERLHDRWQRDE